MQFYIDNDQLNNLAEPFINVYRLENFFPVFYFIEK